ncbi:MAG: DUF3299 domain-containing protein [Bacteroidota bacterium]
MPLPLLSDGSRLSWSALLVAGAAILLMTWNPVPEHELPDDTPWHLLMQAEGLETASPVLPDSLLQLDGQPIRLTGFMYPLEQQRGHRRFLLSPYPPGCPFHAPNGMPGTLSSTVEVIANERVPFTYEAVAIQGTFALADGAMGGVSYQLRDANQEDLP